MTQAIYEKLCHLEIRVKIRVQNSLVGTCRYDPTPHLIIFTNEAGRHCTRQVILPRKAVGELRKLLDDYDGEVSVGLSETRAEFGFGAVRLTSKLIDGTFPDYQRVIPKENLNKLMVSKSEFSKAIEAC